MMNNNDTQVQNEQNQEIMSNASQTQAQPQPQGAPIYEINTQRATLTKNPQDGTRVYEKHTYQAKLHTNPVQGSQLFAAQPQTIQLEDVQPQNLQSQDVELENVQQQDVQAQDLQAQDTQVQDVQPQDVQIKDTHFLDARSQSIDQGIQFPETDTQSQTYDTQSLENQPSGSQLQASQEEKFEERQASQSLPQVQQPEETVVYTVYKTRVQSQSVLPQGSQSQLPGLQKMGSNGSQQMGSSGFQQMQGGIGLQQMQSIGSQPMQSIESQQMQGGSGFQQMQGGSGLQQMQGGNDSQITSGISNLSVSNFWTQPLPDARGTVTGPTDYDREYAKRDAMDLLRSMKGDKDTIAEISGNRTFAQRQMIAKEYALIYDSVKQDLVQDLQTLSGDLETLVVPLYMTPGEYDARLLEKSMQGVRNDVDLLIEVLCTRTNKEIQDLKQAWREKIDSKMRLEEKVGDETKKWFGATTNFHMLCLNLLDAKRPPCAKPDETQVRTDADNLYHQLVDTNNVKDAKAKFVEVFTQRSWTHIGAVVNEFQRVSKEWTVEAAISHEFGDRSNTTKALLVIAEFCSQPYDFWARRLRDALGGLATDDKDIVRIIVSRSEVDLKNVVEVFGQRYGDGRTLKNWIVSEAKGPYAHLLSSLCGY